MAASGAEEGGQLIPGLPEDIVVAAVISRLPWYTRPVCRALSKAWRTMLDTRNPELDARTRMIQLPLLRGLFLFCAVESNIFIRDNDVHQPLRVHRCQIEPHWRELPPLEESIVRILVASSGMVYVWSISYSKTPLTIWKLDLGRADWTWKVVPDVFTSDTSDAVSFNGKIYARTTDSQSGEQVVFEHDMTTSMCKQVETWNKSGLRVLSRRSRHGMACSEEMYAIEEDSNVEKLRVVMYDVESDSWRMKEEVPMPEVPWTRLAQVQLLNSDCVEPASQSGIYVIVWYDEESKLMLWSNSSARSAWVRITFDHIPHLEGRHLESIVAIAGWMYGILRIEEEPKEEPAVINRSVCSGFWKRALMKGKIHVETNTVIWEKVYDLGVFEQIYMVDQPHGWNVWYTIMV